MPYIKADEYRRLINLEKADELDKQRFHELYMFYLQRFIDYNWTLDGKKMTHQDAQKHAAIDAQKCLEEQKKKGY